MSKPGRFDRLPSTARSLKSRGALLASLPHRLFRLLQSEEGQAMVEYAVLLVLLAVVVMVVLIVLGNQVRNVFCNITGSITTRGPG
jgi:pilus assembly protein Flp/PilA